jgi:hypothetical protein
MNVTMETLRRVQQQLLAQGITWDMAKAAMGEMRNATFNAPGSPTTGLNFYNLEPIAKRLYPAYTPLRNLIPRKQGPGGTAVNWRAITRINTGALPMGIPDGVRAPVLSHEVKEFTAKYVEIGSETSVTFLAQLAGMGFDDVRAQAALAGLRSTQIMEEKYLIGALGTYGLGTTPTPTLTPSNTGGSLTAAASPYHVRVVALSMDGKTLASLTVGVPTVLTMTSASPRATTFTVNGGAGQVSADATASNGSGSSGSIAATVAAVPGAVAYAWFIGTDGTTNCRLAAITSVNKATLTAVPSAIVPPTGYAGVVGTNFDTDHSQNGRVFDGIIGIMGAAGSGSTITSLDGATLTADGAGGVVEIDALLQSMATNYKVSPENMWVNFQQAADIAKKIGASGATASLYHIMVPSGGAQAGLTGGIVVKSYQNKFALDPAKREIAINVHPDVPAGMILYTSQELPPVAFPDANIDGVLQVETLEEYTQREWPLVDRQYESGVYVTEVLKCYAPFSLGMHTNVAAG